MNDPLSIRGIGGMDEIGGSCLVFSCAGDRVLIDFGIRPGTGSSPLYPEYRDTLSPGRTLFLTHGHLDHSGGFSLFREIYPECCISGSRETACLTAARGDSRKVEILKPWETVIADGFSLTPFPVPHSVPGAFGYIITHSGRTVVCSGDFNTRKMCDESRMVWERVKECSGGKIDLFLCDGTGLRNTVPGPTEDEVAGNLKQIFKNEFGDIYATCFSSNWERIASLCAAAEETGRHVFLSGTSMEKSVAAASASGYKNLTGTAIPIFRGQKERKLVIAAGSQGESVSAFFRLSGEGTPLGSEDAVVFSASPVPGNELPVRHLLDRFSRITERIYAPPLDSIHAGGHASRPEIAFVLGILKPEAWLPVHCDPNAAASAFRKDLPGEVPFRLARGCEIVVDSGIRLEKSGRPSNRFTQAAPAEEKQRLFEEGFVHLIISRTGSEIGSAVLHTRGFVRQKSAAAFLEEVKLQAEGCAQEGILEGIFGSGALAARVRGEIADYIFSASGRTPEILVTFVDCSRGKG